MKLRDLAYLAVRILSIYLMIQGLRHILNLIDFAIPTYLQLLEDPSYFQVFLVIGIPAFVFIISGILLWFYAAKLSIYLIPKNSDDSVPTIQGKEIEEFILSVVGMIIVILSFSSLIRGLLIYISNAKQDFGFANRANIYNSIEQAIQLILGIALLLKSKGIALVLRKIRSAGLRHINKQDEN